MSPNSADFKLLSNTNEQQLTQWSFSHHGKAVGEAIRRYEGHAAIN